MPATLIGKRPVVADPGRPKAQAASRCDAGEPCFITAEIEAGMKAAGYEFHPPTHVRTRSARDLFGCQPGPIPDTADISGRGVFSLGAA
jgi:hypothetical protein